LCGWLYNYKAATPGIELDDNATVRLDYDNEPQPDLLLRILPEAEGRASQSEDDYLEGAPELVAEIASSSVSYDLHEKMRAYRRNGVQEYIVWLVEEGRIQWWELSDGEYVVIPAESGILKSRVYPGLWLDAAALIAGRSADVLRTFQQGLASAEHAGFVAKIQAKLIP
jgi:Uma2 family endonuclease